MNMKADCKFFCIFDPQMLLTECIVSRGQMSPSFQVRTSEFTFLNLTQLLFGWWGSDNIPATWKLGARGSGKDQSAKSVASSTCDPGQVMAILTGTQVPPSVAQKLQNTGRLTGKEGTPATPE